MALGFRALERRNRLPDLFGAVVSGTARRRALSAFQPARIGNRAEWEAMVPWFLRKLLRSLMQDGLEG
jgi:hypothetical protein